MKRFVASISVKVTEKDVADWPVWINDKLDEGLVKRVLAGKLANKIEDMVHDIGMFNFDFRVEEEKEVK